MTSWYVVILYSSIFGACCADTPVPSSKSRRGVIIRMFVCLALCARPDCLRPGYGGPPKHCEGGRSGLLDRLHTGALRFDVEGREILGEDLLQAVGLHLQLRGHFLENRVR